MTEYSNNRPFMDYSLHCLIGKGSYGTIALVQKKECKKFYAMKIIEKKKIDSSALREQAIMANITHPFVLKSYDAYRSDEKFCFSMDFCSGGDLGFHLKETKEFKPETIQFYAAEISLGLQCLHEANIVYRDLKPSNILLDSAGHIKLTDFGLSKEEVNCWSCGCKTLCGTPGYMAVEVITGQSYGSSCDWWSLGAVAYELRSGLLPYRGKTVKEILHNTLKKRLVLVKSWPKEFKDFLRGLLNKNPQRRLGINGIEEVLNHPFLAGMDYKALLNLEVEAPIQPKEVPLEENTQQNSLDDISERGDIGANNSDNASDDGDDDGERTYAGSEAENSTRRSSHTTLSRSHPSSAISATSAISPDVLNVNPKKIDKISTEETVGKLFQDPAAAPRPGGWIVDKLRSLFARRSSKRGGPNGAAAAGGGGGGVRVGGDGLDGTGGVLNRGQRHGHRYGHRGPVHRGGHGYRGGSGMFSRDNWTD